MSKRVSNVLVLSFLSVGLCLSGLVVLAQMVDGEGLEWLVNGDNVRTYPEPAPRNPPITDDGRPQK